MRCICISFFMLNSDHTRGIGLKNDYLPLFRVREFILAAVEIHDLVFVPQPEEIIYSRDLVKPRVGAAVMHGDYRLCAERDGNVVRLLCTDGVEAADGYHEHIYLPETGKSLNAERVTEIAQMCDAHEPGVDDGAEVIAAKPAELAVVVGRYLRDFKIGLSAAECDRLLIVVVGVTVAANDGVCVQLGESETAHALGCVGIEYHAALRRYKLKAGVTMPYKLHIPQPSKQPSNALCAAERALSSRIAYMT